MKSCIRRAGGHLERDPLGERAVVTHGLEDDAHAAAAELADDAIGTEVAVREGRLLGSGQACRPLHDPGNATAAGAVVVQEAEDRVAQTRVLPALVCEQQPLLLGGQVGRPAEQVLDAGPPCVGHGARRV